MCLECASKLALRRRDDIDKHRYVNVITNFLYMSLKYGITNICPTEKTESADFCVAFCFSIELSA